MRTPIVPRTLPRLLALASLSLACSSSDGGEGGSDIPDYSGFSGVTPAPGAAPGVTQTPGAAPSAAGGIATPAGTEGQGTPPLAGPATPGAPAASGGAAAPAAPGTPTDPAATPPAAVPGTGSMVDVTILAEATVTDPAVGGFNLEGTAPQRTIGGMEVGSVACFDNIDLTGVQSIDVSYARMASAVSASGRVAILLGGSTPLTADATDLTAVESIGEKLTGDTGDWTVFQTINIGLSRAVTGVNQLCFRGLQGNGILNIQSFTLRGTPGTNDGVTNFNPPVPTGPAVAPVRVVDGEVQFGGPGTSKAGNSFFWSNGKYSADLFYNADVVKWLHDDWGSQIVRAAMAVDDNKPTPGEPIATLGGYLTRPVDNELNVQKVVNAAIENGMYAIIDFHAHRAQDEAADAVEFFRKMATKYGAFDNVIYEIYNEPTGIDWPGIKAYAQPVIDAIRAVDPDNLIIVGTPEFSQRVDQAAADPIDDNNVAYTLHFYAATHGQGLRDQATAAINMGAALFVTEWGTTPADGHGNPDTNATNTWMQFLKDNNISHANWGVSDEAVAGAAQLVRGASPSGNWTDAQLSASGRLAKGIIQGW